VTASDLSPADQGLAAIVPGRLAATREADDLPDSVVDPDHKRVVKEALEWQQSGGQAWFWEMGATHRGADQDRAYVLAGQMASAGEQIGLAYAAGNEVAIWRDFRTNNDPDVAHELPMRGMAEAQCLFVMSTGHAFANVGLKALALDPGLKSELAGNFGGSSRSPSFDPFSTDRRDWVSMNRVTCKALKAVAQSSAELDVVELIEPVVEFGFGAAWRELDERRGEDFHRWRPQSHGVDGVLQKTPWSSDGKTRTLKMGNPTYDEAQGLADDVAHIGQAAMLALARAMERFRQQWAQTSVLLGGPEFGSTS